MLRDIFSVFRIICVVILNCVITISSPITFLYKYSDKVIIEFQHMHNCDKKRDYMLLEPLLNKDMFGSMTLSLNKEMKDFFLL